MMVHTKGKKKDGNKGVDSLRGWTRFTRVELAPVGLQGAGFRLNRVTNKRCVSFTSFQSSIVAPDR